MIEWDKSGSDDEVAVDGWRLEQCTILSIDNKCEDDIERKVIPSHG